MPMRILLTLALLVVPIAGCSEAALDRAKHFFFEVPDDSAETDAESAGGEAAQPQPEELTPPESRFASIHRPVVERKCAACHDPAARMQVREDLTDACMECHPRYFDEDEVIHGPVMEGECRLCHVLHRSEYPHLLVAPGGETCVDCHGGAEDQSEEAHSGPGADQCARCHEPHFGEPPLLKPKPWDPPRGVKPAEVKTTTESDSAEAQED